MNPYIPPSEEQDTLLEQTHSVLRAAMNVPQGKGTVEAIGGIAVFLVVLMLITVWIYVAW
jgi:hypothetical protein